MSVKIMGQVWEKDLPQNKAWVLMAYADHADHDGNNAFPAIDLIAWKTNYKPRQVRRIVAELRNDMILVPQGHTPGGVVIYSIRLGHVRDKAPMVKMPPHRPKGTMEMTARERGCKNDTPFYGLHNHQSLINNSERSNLTVEHDSNSSLSSTMSILTLSSLRDFDPHPVVSGDWERSLCPLCGSDKPRDNNHRSFVRPVADLGYICHRCGATGRLGSDPTYRQNEVKTKQSKPKSDWREVWARSNVMPLLGTVGEKYLRGRGIDPLQAAQSGVVFAGSLYKRAAVCFPIHNAQNVLVAIQGRHVDKSEPRMHTIGPLKEGVFKTAGAFESNRLAVVEAPIDALSFAQMYQIPAIAVCGSGPMPDWVVKQFRGELLLASDNDKAGEKAASIWTRQAGSKIVTRRVCPDSKDWNSDLQAVASSTAQ